MQKKKKYMSKINDAGDRMVTNILDISDAIAKADYDVDKDENKYYTILAKNAKQRQDDIETYAELYYKR